MIAAPPGIAPLQCRVRRMNRTQLIERLAAGNPELQPADVDCAVRLLLKAMAAHLESGQRIEIRGFGSFERIWRKARKARNPRSGAPVMVPGKFAPRFKAGRPLRERIEARRGRRPLRAPSRQAAAAVAAFHHAPVP